MQFINRSLVIKKLTMRARQVERENKVFYNFMRLPC